MVWVIDFETPETQLGQITDVVERKQSAARTRPSMRKDSYSPGRCHQFDGVLERSVVLGTVVSPSTGQQVGESLTDARHHPRSPPGSWPVRASDGRPGVGQGQLGRASG